MLAQWIKRIRPTIKKPMRLEDKAVEDIGAESLTSDALRTSLLEASATSYLEDGFGLDQSSRDLSGMSPGTMVDIIVPSSLVLPIVAPVLADSVSRERRSPD